MVDNNFITRMLSSIVILLIFSFATYFSDLSFYLLIFSIAVLSSFEWYNLTQGNKILYVFALLLIALPSASLIYLYNLPQGKYALVWFVLTIWGIDITAYLFGKNFGGAKTCPILSPGKTWTGLLGAILAGVVCTIFESIFFGLFSIFYSPIIGLAIAILAQLGDFTESLVKRTYGVKDSGSMILGHGGVLDRMDSFIFTAPLIAIYISKVCRRNKVPLEVIPSQLPNRFYSAVMDKRLFTIRAGYFLFFSHILIYSWMAETLIILITMTTNFSIINPHFRHATHLAYNVLYIKYTYPEIKNLIL